MELSLKVAPIQCSLQHCRGDGSSFKYMWVPEFSNCVPMFILCFAWKQAKDKSGGVNTSWLLPAFSQDINLFIKTFICIWSCFRVFSGLGTYWTWLELLDHFVALRKALLKAWSWSLFLQEVSINAIQICRSTPLQSASLMIN